MDADSRARQHQFTVKTELAATELRMLTRGYVSLRTDQHSVVVPAAKNNRRRKFTPLLKVPIAQLNERILTGS